MTTKHWSDNDLWLVLLGAVLFFAFMLAVFCCPPAFGQEQMPPGCYSTTQPLHCQEIDRPLSLYNYGTDNVQYYGAVMGTILNRYFMAVGGEIEKDIQVGVLLTRNQKLRQRIRRLERMCGEKDR